MLYIYMCVCVLYDDVFGQSINMTSAYHFFCGIFLKDSWRPGRFGCQIWDAKCRKVSPWILGGRGSKGKCDYKVVPQFGIAKLVNITPISLWFMVDITN